MRISINQMATGIKHFRNFTVPAVPLDRAEAERTGGHGTVADQPDCLYHYGWTYSGIN